jgi:hypothetical protein
MELDYGTGKVNPAAEFAKEKQLDDAGAEPQENM